MEKESIFLWTLIAIAGFLSYLIVKPILTYVLTAVILTFMTFPVYKVVKKVFRSHTISALLVIFLLFILIIAPSFYVGKVLFVQTSAVIAKAGSFSLTKLNTTEIEQSIHKFTGQEIDIKQKIRDSIFQIGSSLTKGLVGFAGKLTAFSIGIFVMLFTMFYLYSDGLELLEDIKKILPMKKEHKEYLFDELSSVTWAMLAGHVLTAVVQGALAALGFFIFGFPNALFWGFITIILCILPYIGPFMVFIPMGIYALFTGDLFSGIGILVYGFVFLQNVDNLLRPKLVYMQSKIHPVAVVVGVVGGLYLFGLIGLVIGPLIIALFVALLRVYQEKEEISDYVSKKDQKTKKKNKKSKKN